MMSELTTQERVEIKRKVIWYDRTMKFFKVVTIAVTALLLLGFVGEMDRTTGL